MANKSSAKKEVRKNKKRYAHNKSIKSNVRTHARKAETLLQAGSATEAVEAIRQFESVAMRAGRKGIINAITMSRKVSRLTIRLKALLPKANG